MKIFLYISCIFLLIGTLVALFRYAYLIITHNIYNFKWWKNN